LDNAIIKIMTIAMKMIKDLDFTLLLYVSPNVAQNLFM